MAKLIYDRMSQGVMEEVCKRIGIKPAKTVVATAAVIARYYAKTTQPKDDLAECSTCKGKSDFKLESCPYCGDAGKVEPPADGAGGAEGEAAGSKGTIVVAAEVLSADAISQTERSPAEVELDEAVAKIAGLRRKSAEDLWELGHAIRDVYTRELWLVRRKPGTSKPLYSRFAQFCEMELGISRPLAYELMDVAQTFSLEQIKKYGATKLGLVVKLPAKERERLLEQFGTGGKRDLAKEARASREATGSGGGTGSKKGKAGKGGKAGKAPPEPRAISVIVRMGEKAVVPLLRGGVRKERHPLAKSLADHPWGLEKHGNGTETHYSVQANPDNGALELVIERRRA